MRWRRGFFRIWIFGNFMGLLLILANAYDVFNRSWTGFNSCISYSQKHDEIKIHFETDKCDQARIAVNNGSYEMALVDVYGKELEVFCAKEDSNLWEAKLVEFIKKKDTERFDNTVDSFISGIFYLIITSASIFAFGYFISWVLLGFKGEKHS
jgi:hypothetical protein